MVDIPKESNLPPSGVEVQSTGIRPIANEMARTRSSVCKSESVIPQNE